MLTPVGWISIYTLEAENVLVLAGMNLLENHDISFRRNEFLVRDAEGHARSVPLRRSPSGHRILNLLFLGQRAASCFSHATAGDFSENPREQNLNRIISLHVWFVPASRFTFLSARKSGTCQLTRSVVYSCLDTVRVCCFAS